MPSPSRPHRRRSRTRRVAPRRTKTGPPAFSVRSRALRDATEDVGDLFDESVRHLLLSDTPVGWSAGPVRALGVGEVEPGTLGWSVAIQGGTGEGSSDRIPSVGEVFLFVLPRSNADRRRPTDPPLVGHRWPEFGSVDHDAGPPRLLLLTHPAVATERGALGRWARLLFRRVLDELA